MRTITKEEAEYMLAGVKDKINNPKNEAEAALSVEYLYIYMALKKGLEINSFLDERAK